MANVKLVWTLPSVRLSGKPLDPATISGVEIAISSDGGENFTVTDNFPKEVLETLFTDLEPGEWQFRGVVIDTAGRRSPEAFSAVSIEDTTAPGPVTLVSTLE